MLRRWVIRGLLVLAALLLAGRFVSAAFVDYLWFDSLGAAELWRLKFTNTLLLGAASSVIAILFLFGNLYAVRRSVVSLVLPRRIGNIEIGEEVPGRYLTQLAIAVSVIGGLFLSLPRDRWLEFAAARHGAPFLERDPVYEYDLGYFVNWLPFERAIFTWCLILTIVAVVVVLFLYALTPSLRWARGEGFHVSLYVRRHAGILFGVSLIVLAWHFRLQMLDSLLSGSGVEGAFTEVDRQMLSAQTALTVVTMLAAFLLAWALWTDQIRLAFFCVTSVILVMLGIYGLAPVILRSGGSAMGASAQIAEDRQYSTIRAGRTRRAYAVDQILPAEPMAAFSFPSYEQAETGAPVWDADQFERAAYTFPKAAALVGNAGYTMGASGQRAVAVVAVSKTNDTSENGPRELQLLTMPSGATTSDGGLPGESPYDVRALPHSIITEPAPAYRAVADTFDQIRAPSLSTFIARLAHGWSRQDFSMISGTLPEPNPKILLLGSVRDRVRKLTPFFEQDSRVHPILHADTLFWALRLYAATSSYPLSNKISIGENSYSYFQYAATAIVNSVTGIVRVYYGEPLDPVAQGWIKLLPSLFTHVREIPAPIARELPPAVDAARAQAHAFAKYGGRTGEESGGSVADALQYERQRPRAHYSLVHFPVISPASAWIQPVLDANDRLHYLIVAVGGDYPKTYRMTFPGEGQSWREIIGRFDLELNNIADKADGAVFPGPLRAIPIGNEVALLRTTYVASSTSASLAIAGVTVMRNDSLHTARSFAEAARVRPAGENPGALGPEEFRARVSQLYQEMNAALRRGDLNAFGDAYNRLGQLLARSRR